jgi:transposase
VLYETCPERRKKKEKKMNRGMMWIIEGEEKIEELMRKEKDATKMRKLQMLYLLTKGKAKNRKEVSEMIGVSADTVGKWLRKYESGGIKGVLKRKPRGGTSSTLSKEVIEAMKEKLSKPEGFTTYHQLKSWVETTFLITTTYWVIYYTSTVILKSRLAVGRKSHIKKTQN